MPVKDKHSMARAIVPVWQDREIRFDLPNIVLRKGESVVDSINSVEDTKGNNGQRGSLEITNLRLLWASHKNIRVNLSIGYNCILSLKIKLASSKLRGNTQALYIMTKFNSTRFEFVFTSLVASSPRLFTTIQAIYRSYETTTLYRDLKLRGALIRDDNLLLLPQEHIYTRVKGVWNLSAEQGNLGTFFVTNIRLVWHANLAPNFNVSLPYMQINSLNIRGSKFGSALVLESRRPSGYVLGFRVDPAEKLNALHEEIVSLWSVFGVNPLFGVEVTHEEVTPGSTTASSPATSTLPLSTTAKSSLPSSRRRTQGLLAQDLAALQDEDLMDDTRGGGGTNTNGHDTLPPSDVFSLYYAAANKTSDRTVVYDPALGLAMEAVPEGLTREALWHVT